MSADEFERISPTADDFFTMGHGDTLEAAFDRARQKWLTAIIVPAQDDEAEEDDE